jgi:hypothetical protein
MKKRLLMPMNLQLFAEGGEGGSDNGAGGGASTNSQQGQQSQGEGQQSEGSEGDQGTGKTFSREDVAKMITAETAKAVAKAQEEWKAEQSEATKLAQMNADQKAEYEREKLEAKIAELEQQQTLSEMSKTATKMLADKGVQANEGILSFVVKDTAEDTAGAVKGFLALIDEQREIIKADVEQRLGGKVPLDGTSQSETVGEYGKTLAQRTKVETPKNTYFKN